MENCITEQPENCKEDFDEKVCESCPLRNYHMVPHPGGSSTHSTESHFCDLGYWEDEF